MIWFFENRPAVLDFQKACLSRLYGEESLFILDSRDWLFDDYSRYEWIVAWSEKDSLRIGDSAYDNFFRMSEFCRHHKGEWIFSYLSYDLKNSIEDLHTRIPAAIPFSLARLVVPKYILTCTRTDTGYQVEGDFPHMPANNDEPVTSLSVGKVIFDPLNKYRIAFEKLQYHIQRGDIYEANLCIEFKAEDSRINPWDMYEKLGEQNPAPFSCFVRDKELFLISASPERFIRGDQHHVISQPMKGTAPRGLDPLSDEEARISLMQSEKEKAENVMIVDLVRNDLGRIAKDAMVKPGKLFEVLPFKRVWQMISTITAVPKDDLTPFDIMAAAFPMGSMTGAPKVRAMEIIEENEHFGRGIFSGSIGYINPEGQFDFNVIIRSLQYNRSQSLISFSAGGAITSGSVCEQEYKECLVKANAIYSLLTGKGLLID